MRVRVDEAGHQRPAADVHLPGAMDLDRRIRDLPDAVVLHQHMVAFTRFRRSVIDDGAVTEDDHGRSSGRRAPAGTARRAGSSSAGG